MKSHRNLSPRSAERAERGLYQAILSLRTDDECRRFISDLCTPAELEALIDRWSVVAHLNDGLSYRTIHELTGVSVTTIGRVARFLTNGSGGYRVALERLGGPR
ncbi:YerC/YecD family TrpR-related protein [Candidatus Rariloculus sp.]|uniref:YerC/YecD family TrpR-related protein n=1 Tax=Candidatus Rariloculus sp. TaxID=3101265 RepID=UPI003D13234D